MDPATLAIIMGLTGVASAGIGAYTGQPAKQGSTYNKGQLSYLDTILQDLKGMKGSGTQDITQNQNYQTGQDWLQGMFNDPEFFKNIEAPAIRQFNEEIVPGVANRFASMGSGGALGSTGFRNQMAREASNLSTNLAAQRGQWQQGAIPQLMNYAQQPFQNYAQLSGMALQPTQNTYQGPTQGATGAFAGPLINAATQMYAGQYGGGGYNGGGGNGDMSRQYGSYFPYVPGQASSTY